MNNILYVEDDLSLIDGLKYTLETSGYTIDISRTVTEALTLFKQSQYDLLLLDVTLPDGTGFDICREVRKLSTVPIIFLTASDEEISIVRGLDMGGDDYITKPFKLNELLSRIKALLRRSTQFSKADTILEANGIKIDTIERLVWKKGTLLELTLIEFSKEKNRDSLILNTMQKLTALSIVGRLENGLDTRIGASLYDDGIDLSGGETQKIVATRTLLDNADIWIFDEPVAAMDPSSEYSFFNTVLEEDDKSKTMIFVSHRLKIASKMNRIIYLENGKIVGIGTHQQLMTGCEKYRRYYVSWLLMEND